MSFNGKLIELKTGNNYVEFPLTYIKAESYKITPDQRLESSANRSASGLLVRSTLSHTSSKIEFETIPITNREANAIHTLLTNAFTDSLRRDLSIKYYDPFSDTYKTADCYMPDIDYPVTRVDGTTIYYDSVRFAFIEY